MIYLIKIFENKFVMQGTTAYSYKLLKMIGLIIILCHVVGTAYHLLAQIEIELEIENYTWLDVAGIRNSGWNIRYSESFYWALATFLLVGSKGETFYETVFCITVLLMTICAFAYILSTI